MDDALRRTASLLVDVGGVRDEPDGTEGVRDHAGREDVEGEGDERERWEH